MNKTDISKRMKEFDLTEKKAQEAKKVAESITSVFKLMDAVRNEAQAVFLAAFLIEYGRQTAMKDGDNDENKVKL